MHICSSGVRLSYICADCLWPALSKLKRWDNTDVNVKWIDNTLEQIMSSILIQWRYLVPSSLLAKITSRSRKDDIDVPPDAALRALAVVLGQRSQPGLAFNSFIPLLLSVLQPQPGRYLRSEDPTTLVPLVHRCLSSLTEHLLYSEQIPDFVDYVLQTLQRLLSADARELSSDDTICQTLSCVLVLLRPVQGPKASVRIASILSTCHLVLHTSASVRQCYLSVLTTMLQHVETVSIQDEVGAMADASNRPFSSELLTWTLTAMFWMSLQKSSQTKMTSEPGVQPEGQNASSLEVLTAEIHTDRTLSHFLSIDRLRKSFADDCIISGADLAAANSLLCKFDGSSLDKSIIEAFAEAVRQSALPNGGVLIKGLGQSQEIWSFDIAIAKSQYSTRP